MHTAYRKSKQLLNLLRRVRLCVKKLWSSGRNTDVARCTTFTAQQQRQPNESWAIAWHVRQLTITCAKIKIVHLASVVRDGFTHSGSEHRHTPFLSSAITVCACVPRSCCIHIVIQYSCYYDDNVGTSAYQTGVVTAFLLFISCRFLVLFLSFSFFLLRAYLRRIHDEREGVQHLAIHEPPKFACCHAWECIVFESIPHKRCSFSTIVVKYDLFAHK